MKKIGIAALAFILSGCVTGRASGPVLIIGDSISFGYTHYVQAELPCVQRTSKIHSNARDTWNVLKKIDKWLDGKSFEIIYFNVGLWDVAHRFPHSYHLQPVSDAPMATTPEQYRENLEKIVSRLQKTGAILIFATTTDVPQDSLGRENSDIVDFNRIAKEVMDEHGIPVDDLYDWMRGSDYLHKTEPNGNKAHYTSAGFQLLAEKVTATLKGYGACSIASGDN